jgi:hypothetical protein
LPALKFCEPSFREYPCCRRCFPTQFILNETHRNNRSTAWQPVSPAAHFFINHPKRGVGSLGVRFGAVDGCSLRGVVVGRWKACKLWHVRVCGVCPLRLARLCSAAVIPDFFPFIIFLLLTHSTWA